LCDSILNCCQNAEIHMYVQI